MFSWWDKKQNSNNKSYQKKLNKCFQYALTVVSNNEEIGKLPERITKIKPFIDEYNWQGRNYPSNKMVGKYLRKVM